MQCDFKSNIVVWNWAMRYRLALAGFNTIFSLAKSIWVKVFLFFLEIHQINKLRKKFFCTVVKVPFFGFIYLFASLFSSCCLAVNLIRKEQLPLKLEFENDSCCFKYRLHIYVCAHLIRLEINLSQMILSET